MDTSSTNPPPAKPAPAVNLNQKQARESELKRNREIGHLLKGGGFRQHQLKRTMPHVRGR